MPASSLVLTLDSPGAPTFEAPTSSRPGRLVGATAPNLTPTPPPPPIQWQSIPVFIINRNRLSALRRLVQWLMDAGTRRVVILDNDSDYPPLLAYYAQLPCGVKVLPTGGNHGPYVLWQQGVHRVLDSPYVVTDSDVVPAPSCPGDLVGVLWEQLRRYPDAKKVGTALRIDDLPDGYVEADTVRKWESQFWEHPVAPGVFAAPIDTTFALYPARGEFSNEPCNLRLGDPYVAQHTPWYEDETRLSAEEQHYRAHTSATFSNWSVGKRDSWVQRSQRVACFDRRARVLHMDASAQYIPGWINAGADPQRRDLTFDVRRERPLRLDLDDNSLDGIHLSHVLEGVSDPQALFAELHRVAKPNAKLLIRVRHGARDDAWQDPSQHSVWTECSFSRYSQPAQTAVSDYGGDWDVVEVRLVVDPQACAMSDDQLRDAVLVQRNLIGEMVVTLRAIKPARAACGTRLVSRPAPVIVRDARIDPAFDVV